MLGRYTNGPVLRERIYHKEPYKVNKKSKILFLPFIFLLLKLGETENALFRHEAEFHIDGLAIFEEDQGWDASDAVLGSDIADFVYIDLKDGEIFVLGCDLLKDRGEHLAWSAPRGKEVDKDLAFRGFIIEFS